jgi:hypothetical protein
MLWYSYRNSLSFRGHILFCKNNYYDYNKRVSEIWNHQNAIVFYWQHICRVWRACYSTVGIPVSINSALLFVYSFLSSYEAYFMRGLLKKKNHKLARSVYICYINDVLSFNNSKFGSHCWSHISHVSWNNV